MRYLFKQIGQLLEPIFQMTRLAWQVQPTAFVGVVLLDSLQGLAPLATAWLTKHLFDLFAQGLQREKKKENEEEKKK